MFKNIIRNKKGLTLIEILVATTLILIVMSSFIFVYQSALNLRVNSQRRLEGLTSAQTTIEYIKNAHSEENNQWKDMDDLGTWLVDTEHYVNTDANEYSKGNTIVTLEPVDSDKYSPGEELIEIKVSVEYPDKMNKGSFKSVALRTRLRSFHD